jgi:BirA family transcriptional regulator, biotin operon repressor / biotin---[acetyl-CoA-carboxylase] ligase
VTHVDFLDAAQIAAQIAASASSPPCRVETRDAIDSTNSELLRRGAAAHGVLLIADAQHAGRGRRGRRWQSPSRCNLYLSYGFRSARPVRELGGLSLVAGIACAAALRGLGFVQVGLKWPNDLLARERKLGGLLVELNAGLVVIGVGINLRMPADIAGIDQPWIDLATLGEAPSRNTLASAIMRHLLPMLDEFERDGFAPFAARWEANDALAGRRVRVLAGETAHEGQARGVAADGALRVLLPEGEHLFHSAEVSLRCA